MTVTLTNQTFSEAGGSVEFPDLEMGDYMTVRPYKTKGRDNAIEESMEEMRKLAKKEGYTHVFCVKTSAYLDPVAHPSNNYYVCETTGTGYRKNATPRRTIFDKFFEENKP